MMFTQIPRLNQPIFNFITTQMREWIFIPLLLDFHPFFFEEFGEEKENDVELGFEDFSTICGCDVKIIGCARR